MASQDGHYGCGELQSCAVSTSRVTCRSSTHTAPVQLCTQRTSQPVASEGGQHPSTCRGSLQGTEEISPLNKELLRLSQRKPCSRHLPSVATPPTQSCLPADPVSESRARSLFRECFLSPWLFAFWFTLT